MLLDRFPYLDSQVVYRGVEALVPQPALSRESSFRGCVPVSPSVIAKGPAVAPVSERSLSISVGTGPGFGGPVRRASGGPSIIACPVSRRKVEGIRSSACCPWGRCGSGREGPHVDSRRQPVYEVRTKGWEFGASEKLWLIFYTSKWPCRTIHVFSAYRRAETDLSAVLKEARHGWKTERHVQNHKLEKV